MLCAVRFFKQQEPDPHGLAGIALAPGLTFALNLAEDRSAVECRFPLGVVFGHSPEHAVAVEMQDVDGGLGVVVKALDQGLQCGGPKELPRDATGGMLFQRIEHRPRIGPRINEPGITRTADHKQQMQVFLRLDGKRRASAGSARDPAADANVRLFAKQERARRIVQQLPRQGEDRRIQRVDGEHALLGGTLAESQVRLDRFHRRKHGFEKRFADFRQPRFDAFGFLIVGIGASGRPVRFDVPAEVAAVLTGNRVPEFERPGIRTAERDFDLRAGSEFER